MPLAGNGLPANGRTLFKCHVHGMITCHAFKCTTGDGMTRLQERIAVPKFTFPAAHDRGSVTLWLAREKDWTIPESV